MEAKLTFLSGISPETLWHVLINYGKKQFQTSYKQGGANPRWNEQFPFDVYFLNQDEFKFTLMIETVNKPVMSSLEKTVRDVIEVVWGQYDKDKSGFLDKKETKGFVKSILNELGESSKFSDKEFDSHFKAYDKDSSNALSKEEITVLIKVLMHMDTVEP
jgi:Ca2+-binding EF-hand superfamily protein